MDGTFLNSQGDYNRALFRDVVTAMAHQGVHFAPCTGKQVDRVEELLGEESANFWILGDSATRIKHRGQYVYQSLLGNTLGLAIIDRLAHVPGSHITIACTAELAFIREDIAPHLKELVHRSYSKVKTVGDFNEIGADFVKITVYDEQGRCPALRGDLGAFNDDAYIVVSEKNWIDIANAGVHKGSTVARLQALVGAGRHETLVFGDGLNDVELMGCADLSFAMRNGCDETKAAANFITRSNDDDAVMHTILRLLALQSGR
ncbi:HAD family hydrolase [Aeromonas veronii]|uniref:HAD family hydrolase n=1 Tax=Aeromonas veronii TaxID=654 RepID=UPI0032EAAD7D